MDDRRPTDAESTGPADIGEWPRIDVAALPHLGSVTLTHSDESSFTWTDHMEAR